MLTHIEKFLAHAKGTLSLYSQKDGKEQRYVIARMHSALHSAEVSTESMGPWFQLALCALDGRLAVALESVRDSSQDEVGEVAFDYAARDVFMSDKGRYFVTAQCSYMGTVEKDPYFACTISGVGASGVSVSAVGTSLYQALVVALQKAQMCITQQNNPNKSRG